MDATLLKESIFPKPLTTVQTHSERFRKIIPRIRELMTDEGLETDPTFFPELVARVYCGEMTGGKGVLLQGKTGSGKTARAVFMKRFCGIGKMVFADELGAIWKDGGDEAVLEECRCLPCRWDVMPPRWNDLIIDDLGLEETIYNSYGNTRDVISMVLTKRYEVFPHRKTYITTNIGVQDLKERYGERVYSRLNEMCAFVQIQHADRRMEQKGL